ncbi:hypothetical protein PI125_g14852 [Phytophthora idaei]|nr:hypothetical protein PI125_g14852 [Phytophthora idaei]
MEQASADEDASSPVRNEAADLRATGEAASSDSEWSDADESPVPSIVDDEDYETHDSCEELQQTMDDIEDASALPKEKRNKRTSTRKKAKKDSTS